MNTDSINALTYLYIFVAIIVSIFVAQALEKRLKANQPATRPYRWGFYVGCMGVACAALAVLTGLGMLVSGMNARWQAFGECLFYTLFLSIHAVAGWYIIKRQRWAWITGTVLSCNIFAWIINYIYGRNRWGEFIGESYGSSGSEDEGFDLLHDATKMEMGGRIQEALLAYQQIADKYAHNAAGRDAQKS